MELMHVWAAVGGGAAIGLPILVHWLTRPRPMRLPISTLRFIREAIHQRRAMHRLRDFIILGLRVLAVILLAAMFARPLLGRRPVVSAQTDGESTRVIVLDVSASMAAASHGVEAFERARPIAARYLSYMPGLRANLVLAGAQPRAVFEKPSSNLGSLRDELARVRPRPERMDVPAAIRAAAKMLADGGGAERCRELVVISDFQQADWSEVDFSALPEDTRIQLESVATAEPPPNLAVLHVEAAGRAAEGDELILRAEVGNFSPAARQVQVEFDLGDALYLAEGLCPANGRTVLTVRCRPLVAGWQSGQARLMGVEDALPADDVRPFVVNVSAAATYALITRHPADALATSSYYLERALVPARPREDRAGERVLRMQPNALDREELASCDLIALVAAGQLSDEAIDLLVWLLQRGRPMLYVATEPADAINLQRLADKAGAAMRLPVRFAPYPTSRARVVQTLVDIREQAQPFAVFGDAVQAVIAPLRLSPGLATQDETGALIENVSARYEDGTAFLVFGECGGGGLAVLNADLAASNLPTSPAFVPLVGELAARLIGDHQAPQTHFCGQPLHTYLPAEVGTSAGLIVRPPSPTADPGTLTEDGQGVAWQCTALGGPGIYTIVQGEKPCLAMAAVLDPRESDLRAADADALVQTAAGRALGFKREGGQEQARDDLWVWLAAGCVACLLMELVALRVLRT